MSKSAVIIYVLIVTLTSGCSVGGQYGYDTAMTSPTATSYRTVDLVSLTDPFMFDEFSPPSIHGEPERLTSLSDSVEYIVRGLRGYVVRGNNQWEKLQVTFTLTRNGEVAVSVDGWLASGFQYPSDTQFTTSMETTFPDDLHMFTEKLAGDFHNYLIQNARR
jgi:hypothetical protein